MNVRSNKLKAIVFLTVSMFVLSMVAAPLIPHYGAAAQNAGGLRKLEVEFVPEAGSPITVSNVRADMKLDPAGNPVAAITSIEYRNTSQKPILAARFRIRYYDQSGKTRGTQQAMNVERVEPGATGSQKWPTRGIDPTITSVKIRLLTANWPGGEEWQSAKMPELFKSQAPASASNDGGGEPAEAP